MEESGLIVRFDENRRNEVLITEGATGAFAEFSDALSTPDLPTGRMCVAILSFSDTTFDYVALAKKGKQVVSYKAKVTFSDIVHLDAVSISSIESRIGGNLKRYFVLASQGIGGHVPETTWASVLAALKAERPRLAADIDRLRSLSAYAGYILTGSGAEVLMLEREAVGAALDIFSGGNKLRDSVLTAWAPPKETVTDVNEARRTGTIDAMDGSFLSGIPQRHLQEESALQHDLVNWPGISGFHAAGISVFEQGQRRLEIIYANKNHLERALGVDLIYYVGRFDAFVLVQYKLMPAEGYRPDAQLRAELQRMDDFRDKNERMRPIQDHKDFRLNDDGFMFKLVPNRGLRPASGELIKGMYIPRDYMHFLLSERGPKGKLGGAMITFENAPRYLTNSDFAAHVYSGWIGTSGDQSKALEEIVKNYYETGTALVFARETSPEMRPNAGR